MHIIEETSYESGKRQALVGVIRHAIRELDLIDKLESDKYRWVIERSEAIAQLREICGDNDWDDSLHLGDIIEKHLARYL